ncbi:hypothetical protein P4S54_20320 [Shewanella sp. PP-He15 brown]
MSFNKASPLLPHFANIRQPSHQSKQGRTSSKRPLLNIEHNATKHYGNKHKCQSIFTNLQEELGI